MSTPKQKIIARLLATVIITVLALTCQGSSVLLSGETLEAGQSLDEGSYSLKMQPGCNLALYFTSTVIWKSNEGTGRKCFLKMQEDGNLVIYDHQNTGVVWSSNTWQGFPGSYILVLQRDRNIVIYGRSYWSTGTGVRSVGGVVANGTKVGGATSGPGIWSTATVHKEVNTTAVGKVVTAAS